MEHGAEVHLKLFSGCGIHFHIDVYDPMGWGHHNIYCHLKGQLGGPPGVRIYRWWMSFLQCPYTS